MKNWKRNLFFLWLAQFFSIVGFGFAMPFIPFYIQSLGVESMAERSMWVAQFAAMGNLGLCLFSPIWGWLSDIYGRKIMILRANFMAALLMPMMAFVPGPGWLVPLRFLVGVFAGTVTATLTLASSNTPLERRGFAMGALSSAVYSGSITGSFLGGLTVDIFGFRTTFFICGAILMIAGILVMLGVREDFTRTVTLREKIVSFRFRLPEFGSIWFLLLLIMMIGFAVQFDLPFLPVLVETVNGPERAATWTGIIASVSAVAGILAGLILGWLSDRGAAHRVAIWSALLAGCMMIPQGLAWSLGILIPARFVTVFFAGGLDPVFQIWLAKSTPDNKRGLFFGWALSAKTMGWFLGACCSGLVAMFMGVRMVYFTAALMFILLIPAIRFTTRKIEKKPELGS